MKAEILNTNTILSFVENKLELDSFQEWLFMPTTVQNFGNEELYNELILLNYSSNNSRIEVQKLVTQFNLIRILHLNSIKSSLNNFIKEIGSPFEEIENLNKWANKGYTFLGHIDIIGNFEEQNKSIVYDINRKMNPTQQFQILNEKYKTIKEEFRTMLSKIESGKIMLTGKSREIKGFGEIYEFETNE